MWSGSATCYSSFIYHHYRKSSCIKINLWFQCFLIQFCPGIEIIHRLGNLILCKIKKCWSFSIFYSKPYGLYFDATSRSVWNQSSHFFGEKLTGQLQRGLVNTSRWHFGLVKVGQPNVKPNQHVKAERNIMHKPNFVRFTTVQY